MAEIFRRVNGLKFEKFLALEPGVQAAITAEASEMAGRATALLAAHRFEGEAEISQAKGDVDAYVVLEDKAALSIEYGRRHHPETGRGGMEGLYILHDAARMGKGRGGRGRRRRGGRR